ncbi:MAG: sulfatase, partial [bacterium]|nr:sulfatase [bacterium]
MIISFDTLRRDHISYFADNGQLTPNLDEFAYDSIAFENAHTTSPWTVPSMYSMHTSSYPSVHGTDLGKRGNDNLKTTAELLRENGYTTEAYVTNYILRKELGFDKGFERYIEPEDIEYLSYFRRSTIYAFIIRLRYYEFSDKRRYTEWLTNKLCRRLKTKNGQPFFIWAHYMDPHTPFSPPDKYIENIRKIPAFKPSLVSKWKFNESEVRIASRLYKAEVSYIDDSFAQILQVLENERLFDNTLIIVTADHGEEFFEHGEFGHGKSHYNEVMAIPMIVHAPNTESKTTKYPVSLLDVMPTVLSYAGINVPPQAKGRDLLELTDKKPSVFDQEPVFYDQTRWDLTMKSAHIYPYTLIRTGEDDFTYEFVDIRNIRA